LSPRAPPLLFARDRDDMRRGTLLLAVTLAACAFTARARALTPARRPCVLLDDNTTFSCDPVACLSAVATVVRAIDAAAPHPAATNTAAVESPRATAARAPAAPDATGVEAYFPGGVFPKLPRDADDTSRATPARPTSRDASRALILAAALALPFDGTPRRC
jgi:hypothetical protein